MVYCPWSINKNILKNIEVFVDKVSCFGLQGSCWRGGVIKPFQQVQKKDKKVLDKVNRKV